MKRLSQTTNNNQQSKIKSMKTTPALSFYSQYYYTALATTILFVTAEARSWWSLEISALDSIRDADPLYAASSTLLLEDTGFLYGVASPSSPSSSFDVSTDDEIIISTPLPANPPPAISPSAPSAVVFTGGPQNSAAPEASASNFGDGHSSPENDDLPGEVQKIGPFPDPPSLAPASSPPHSSSPIATEFPTGNGAMGGQQQNQPTFSPSGRFEAANGSCPPNSDLHRAWLYDSAGDGWGSTRLVIREAAGSSAAVMDPVFVGGLDTEYGVIEYDKQSQFNIADTHHKERDQTDSRLQARLQQRQRQRRRHLDRNGANQGDKSSLNQWVYLCLERDVCYTAEVSGGTFLEEARWEITKAELGSGENVGLVAAGVGEGSGICSFSLNGGCVKTCDGTAQASPPTRSPNTPPHPSQSPIISTNAPIGTPTESPSARRTRKPVTAMPSAVLPQDKKFAFGFEEYKRIQSVILSASPSSEAALAEEDSPQHRAFEWIYGSNAGGLSDRRLVQRWVLASFYYSTEGDGWIVKSGWLTSGDECQWYGVSCLSGKVGKLELEQNRLVGEIAPEITVWKNDLYVFSLGNDYGTSEKERNRIIMPLPLFLGDLSYLTYLNLEGAGMTSTIPEELFSSWPRLQSLYLNDNDLTGTLPQSIQRLSSIEVMWLGGNNLGGSIVSEIGLLTTLKDLSLESNYRDDTAGKRGFITTIPPQIGQLTNLEVLSLADNALSGQVPVQLGDLISLRRLQLSGNFFEGQLPGALGRLEMLEELDLSFNWLSSTIPAEYGNMISLASLSLNSNYNDNDGYFTWGIKGTLPSELGELKNLQHINLSDNYLTGTLITEFGQLYLLQTLNLKNNFLQGPIPKEYSNSVSLKEIFLQENNIDGNSFGMPAEICELSELDLARVDCGVSCSCCLTTC
mmetsp:Transcript_5418/g.11775  ORF Transcript_5418/g.11775 Transcript_5418/m.11775 type:complete len:912 (+) Transcript_5418:64-2799(+)